MRHAGDARHSRFGRPPATLMSERLYLHVLPGMQKEAAAKLGALVLGW